MGTRANRLDNAAIHAPLKTTFRKEVEEVDESGAKVNTLVFHRFELIPPITEEDEANSSSLYNRVKAAGAETFREWMEPEEGDCAVRIFDLVKLWRGAYPDFDVPNDTYSSMYIYKCIHNESNNLPAPDLKPFLVTPSIYESYEPEEILFRKRKWSELKVVKEVEGTPYKKIIADLKAGKIVAVPNCANSTSTSSNSKEKGSEEAAASSSSASEESSPSSPDLLSDSGTTSPEIPPQVNQSTRTAEKSKSTAKPGENKDPEAPTDSEKSTSTATSSSSETEDDSSTERDTDYSPPSSLTPPTPKNRPSRRNKNGPASKKPKEYRQVRVVLTRIKPSELKK